LASPPSSLAGMQRGKRTVAIVREVYNKWERRAPLCPPHVERLVQQGMRVLVQPSHRRIFRDAEYVAAGAELTEDLSPAGVVLGVKQVPIEALLPERTYVFFSHVIKAQPENMDLLDAVLARKVRLVDYEVINEGGRRNGPRLIAFGRFAGCAGMVGGLRGLGQRLLSLGYSTPLLSVGSAYMYRDLDAAKKAVTEAGQDIMRGGLPKDFAPMTFVFTGNGKVSRGAQEVFEHLPHRWVSPGDLGSLPPDPHCVYGCVIREDSMVSPGVEGASFSRREYFDHPERYIPSFHERIAPFTSFLVNGMYWDHRFPRLLSKVQVRDLRSRMGPRLLGICDISCDIGGSVEFLTKSTEIEQPFFMYDPEQDVTKDSLDGDGIMMCGVDILPSELPLESSMHFGDALVDFIAPLADSDATKPFVDQAADLPPELHDTGLPVYPEDAPGT